MRPSATTAETDFSFIFNPAPPPPPSRAGRRRPVRDESFHERKLRPVVVSNENRVSSPSFPPPPAYPCLTLSSRPRDYWTRRSLPIKRSDDDGDDARANSNRRLRAARQVSPRSLLPDSPARKNDPVDAVPSALLRTRGENRRVNYPPSRLSPDDARDRLVVERDTKS